MRYRLSYIFLLVALCIVGISLWKVAHVRSTTAASSAMYLPQWSPDAAAHYLDDREVWWQQWPVAQRDHGTICISCHTVVPYALARVALQQQLRQTRMPEPEKIMIASVEKRVGQWPQMTPFYSDAADGPGKTAESHATEAVLNAVILASYDAGQSHLRPVTKTALDEAWALQEKTGENAGGWQWQDFHLAPWESKESAYQGAAMLAVAVGNLPNYDTDNPERVSHVQQLKAYLQKLYAVQPLMSQLYVLWASARMPGLLTEAERTKLLGDVLRLQQNNGGWSLSSLDRQPISNRVPNNSESDGCATGLAVLALEESGMNPDDKTLERGLQWLNQHQTKDGSWHATSLNAERDPKSDIGRFMNDAATGYAVLALEVARRNKTSVGSLPISGILHSPVTVLSPSNRTLPNP